jgi:hypothetical protein
MLAPCATRSPTANPGRRGIVELTHICGEVCDNLRVRETMPIGEVFHAEIPPLAMTEGDELAHQNGVILAAYAA